MFMSPEREGDKSGKLNLYRWVSKKKGNPSFVQINKRRFQGGGEILSCDQKNWNV